MSDKLSSQMLVLLVLLVLDPILRTTTLRESQ